MGKNNDRKLSLKSLQPKSTARSSHPWQFVRQAVAYMSCQTGAWHFLLINDYSR